MRVLAPPATTAQQTWKGPQAAQRLGVLFGREGVPSGPAQGGACGVSQVGPGASAVGRWSLPDRRRVGPARWFPARSRAGARGGTAYPSGGRGFSDASGRSAPGDPPARRGPHFSREMWRKRAGGKPPGPPGLGPARSHSLVLAWWGAAGRLLGDYGTHVCTLIWRLSFTKMLSSIFPLENASQIGFDISEEIATRTDQGQRSQKPASGNERL